MRSRFAVSFGTRLDLDLQGGEDLPAAAGALVVPQDVNLIMGETEVVEETAESPTQVAARAARARPARPGSVRVLRGSSGDLLLLEAVVYDFDRSPSTSAGVVLEGLVGAFEAAHARNVSVLAVKPLGTDGSGLLAEQFLRLLVQVCYTAAELGTSLRHVHLLLESPALLARYEALLPTIVRVRRSPQQT